MLLATYANDLELLTWAAALARFISE